MAVSGLSDLSLERRLFQEGYHQVIGIDEVGRGALAGPVSVGVAVFDLAELTDAEVPAGIHDSKRLSAVNRAAARTRVTSWADSACVGSTAPAEIDELGMTMSLNLAARRALAAAGFGSGTSSGAPNRSTIVLLDGSHDWLSVSLTLDCLGIFGSLAELEVPPVRTVVKGDGSVPVIAAASILAKVTRDEQMIDLAAAHPQYGWESNVGYGTFAHREAIADIGPCHHHRRSFRLLPSPQKEEKTV